MEKKLGVDQILNFVLNLLTLISTIEKAYAARWWHTFSPSTPGAEIGRFEFKASLAYR